MIRIRSEKLEAIVAAVSDGSSRNNHRSSNNKHMQHQNFQYQKQHQLEGNSQEPRKKIAGLRRLSGKTRDTQEPHPRCGRINNRVGNLLASHFMDTASNSMRLIDLMKWGSARKIEKQNGE